MSFNRQLEKELLKWKDKPERKPLVLRGARQVGKTTLIKSLANKFKYSIFLNLEKVKDISYFETYEDVTLLIEAIFLAHNVPIAKTNETLLFIDEIQESPNAISILRYIYEDYPDLRVIAAGSLLEHAMKMVKNFPVGRVEFLYLHPLNFAEFLEACGQEMALEQLNTIPVKPFAHGLLMELFNKYIIIGGMPEVVKTYIKNNSLTELPRIYNSIWETYKNDIEKYSNNSNEARIIKHVVNSAHLYIDQRIKFENFGNSNYRSREVGEAMRNLDDAKVIQLIYPTTETEVPIKPDLKKSPRMQFLDTGLLSHTLKIQLELLALKDLSDSYKGAIVPHIITQELISLNQFTYSKPNFWVREKTQSSAEVDLVYQYANYILPIEVKSGKVGKLKSLHQFIEKCNHNLAIRIYGGEFSIERHHTPMARKPYILMNLPYYLGTKLPDYIEYFVKKVQEEKI